MFAIATGSPFRGRVNIENINILHLRRGGGGAESSPEPSLPSEHPLRAEASFLPLLWLVAPAQAT